MFRPGSKLVHPYNPELGVGVVREVDGRFLTVHFPAADREVVLSSEGAGLSRLVLPAGARVQLVEDGESAEIQQVRDHQYLLCDGRLVDDAEVWPAEPINTPIQRLANLDLDELDSFVNRIQGLELMELREAGGLGSFLGGRIELFPHQLHVAQRAVEGATVRWLLADEVGLGKTVEACLILSALLRTGRAQRALVVAPSTLAIQWLGELYRKFHQVFALLDHDRIESVESDYGVGVNPFDVHPFAVVSLELLASDAKLLRLAGEAGLDVVVVDEAHRLVREDHLGTLGPLIREAQHALLLTATPLQADRHGFYALLELLHPKLFPTFEAFDQAVHSEGASVPCTSSIRRVDVGGLPPRVPTPIDVGPRGDDLRSDPRTRWLAAQVPGWVARGEKVLVFMRDLFTLEALTEILESESGTRVTYFHEELSAAKRDIEIAAFRESSLPLLLCTEAGGEGRNFQFCDRMVHFDLPWDPVELEQRIGRLDRIGRDIPVEIVYFRHPAEKETFDLARLYECLDLFARPAAGLDAALACVQPALEAAAGNIDGFDPDAIVAEVERVRGERVEPDLTRVFYPDAYSPDQADAVLELVPSDLESKTRTYCIEAAEDLGFDCVEKGGEALYYIEFGSGASRCNLPAPTW